MASPKLPKTRPLEARIIEGSAIKVIGLGGVGSIFSRYVAVFLASLQKDLRLVLIDGDQFEPGNSSRMLFSSCGNKATVIRDDLLPHLADSALTLVAIEEFVTPENMERLIQPGDIVVLAVDNHATRKQVSDFCASRLDNICLISGGNDGVEKRKDGKFRLGTFGNVQIYLRVDGKEISPSLTLFHPEIAHPADHLPTEQDCFSQIASTPQILFANLMTASAMLNTLWLHLCQSLHYHEVVFDIGEALMRPVQEESS